jgi:3-hydroxyacyl-CoA dehydrogenase / enoyl-CoA hydratase / 3-hydroxybutyryl-CoA epimerase
VTAEKKAEVLGRITATTDYAALDGCDLIVEAVFEDPGIKAEVTRRTEAVIPADCIFATNTSTLPISDLAKASARPEQFIGIHFFSPVDKMMLVEIIKGRETGDRAVAKALDYVRQIRKTPIVVNDARFFYANRCIIPYINEGIRMVGEGVGTGADRECRAPPRLPGGAAATHRRDLDRPRREDREGDEGRDGRGLRQRRGGRGAVLDGRAGPMGRKAKAGFYAYDDAGKRTGLWDGLAARYPVAADQPDLTTVQHRLMMAQVLEAVRALEEGVLTDIREGDVGAILGWGFAPWSGGPFSWLDMIGAGPAVVDLRPARGRPRRPLPRAGHAARHGDERRHVLRDVGRPARPDRFILATSTPGGRRRAGAEPPRPPPSQNRYPNRAMSSAHSSPTSAASAAE